MATLHHSYDLEFRRSGSDRARLRDLAAARTDGWNWRLGAALGANLVFWIAVAASARIIIR